MAKDKIEEAGNKVHTATEKAKMQLKMARDRAVAREQQLESYVQEHPFRAMSIAAGIGFAVGATAMSLRR